MRIHQWILAFGLAAVGSVSAEQGCPDGFIPNAAGTPGAQCVPGRAPDWGDGSPQAPRAYWQKRWGAISFDADAGKFGASNAMASKRKAEKAAIDHCESKGASNCKVVLIYNNQCGAMAFGDGNLTVANAPTQGEADASAMDGCAAKVGRGKCKIYYSDCSYAERVQ